MASEMSTNVTSVEAKRRINPDPAGSLDRVESKRAGQTAAPVRRLTRLDADYYAAAEKAHPARVPGPRAHHPVEDRPARLPKDRVCRLLERAVGGWAPTLRGSLVLVALFLFATALMVVALGVGGLALAAGLAALFWWLNAAGRLPRA